MNEVTIFEKIAQDLGVQLNSVGENYADLNNPFLNGDELLEKVWGYEYYGDTRTVDVHVRHLRAKLQAAPSISDGIKTVRGVGYRFTK